MAANRNADRPRYPVEGASKYRRSAYGSHSLQNADQNTGGMNRVRRDVSRNQFSERQMVDYAPTATNYHTTNRRYMKNEKPLKLWPRVVILVALLAVLVVRFAVSGGDIVELGSVNSQVEEQTAQLEQLSASNEELQASIDERQGTIDAWEEMTASS